MVNPSNIKLRATTVLLMLLLGGCKIIIVAETGGSVTSTSGDHNCPAGNTCEFVEPIADIADVLTAVPQTGYKFASWEGLCKGSLNPSCNLNIPLAFAEINAAWTITANFNYPLVGTWLVGSLDDPDGYTLLTFYEENHYLLTRSCSSELATNSGGGHEYGSYNWDPADNSFSLSVKRSSILGCGLIDELQAPLYDELSVANNTLTLAGADTDSLVMQRITNRVSGPIDGTWLVGNIAQTGGFAQLTLYQGGYVFTTLCDLDAAPGVEIGTFTWDATSKSLGSTRLRDTLGACGLYNDATDTTNVDTLRSRGNRLTLESSATGEQADAFGLF